jgi:GTP-binding protein HflX
VLLSDTVGFIRNLPTSLVHAFRATLEEVADAALILHVIDVSSEQAPAQTAQVFKVLNEIGASGTPQILVLNKSDQLVPNPDRPATDPAALTRNVLRESPNVEHASVLISGLTGAGIADLLRCIDETLPEEALAFGHYRIPAGDGADIARVHADGRVFSVEYHDDVCEIEAAVTATLGKRLERFAVDSTEPVENPVRNSV